ncbi:MAG: outer membrane protein assembly factor BamC [Haliea sp.]|jgi:outer membrane protein assembly factor BamC|nr:outer membrane protein assembly factor BamC [Haliea sp.]
MAMSHRLVKLPAAALLLAMCSGCGYLFGDQGIFRDNSEDYKKAPEMPVVSVPQDKDSSALGEIYPIPAVDNELILAGEFEVPRPAPLVAGAGDEVVRIQKLGDQSWALIGVPPGQVWPQVRSFLTAAGIQVARVDARAGIMETNWLKLEGASMGSRFRFRMEQGVQRGTSELHVLQMNQAGDVDSWPGSSDNPEQAHEMLRAVSQYLANSAESAPVSMIAEQGISAGGKISMQEAPEGYTYIRLELPYDRAWASLGRALGKSGFEVTDRDRSAGRYDARFLGPQDEDEDGWFDWLFGEEEHPLAGQLFLITMTSVSEQAVNIRLQPQDSSLDFSKRDEQSLLALIKGNIN